MKKFLALLTFVAVVSASDLLSIQANVYAGGAPLADGDLRVLLYANATCSSPFYDSGVDFNGSIVNGSYDVMLGSGSVALNVDTRWPKLWWDIQINGTDQDFGGYECLNTSNPFYNPFWWFDGSWLHNNAVAAPNGVNITGVVGNTLLTGNNIEFDRAGPNYIEATNPLGSLYLGSGGTAGVIALTISALTNSIYVNGVGVGIRHQPTHALDVLGDIYATLNVSTPLVNTSCINLSGTQICDWTEAGNASSNTTALWNLILWKKGVRFVELNGSNEELDVSNQLFVKNATETNYAESSWAASETRGLVGQIAASSSFTGTLGIDKAIDDLNLTRWVSSNLLDSYKAQIYVNFSESVNLTHIDILSSVTYTCSFHNFTVAGRNSVGDSWVVIQNFTDNYFNPTAQEQLWTANLSNASTAYQQWMINNTDTTPCMFTRSEFAEIWFRWTAITESNPVQLNATVVNNSLKIRNSESEAEWQLEFRVNGNVTEVYVQDPESAQSGGTLAMRFLPSGQISIPSQTIAYVQLSGTQNIPTSTYTYVNWNTVVTMHGASYVADCPSSLISTPCVCVANAGTYRVVFDVGWQFTGEPISSTAAIRVQPALVVGETATWDNTTQNYDYFTAQERDHTATAWDLKTQHMDGVLDLIAGECVTAAVWHDEGATQKLGINILYNRMLIYWEA